MYIFVEFSTSIVSLNKFHKKNQPLPVIRRYKLELEGMEEWGVY